MPTFTGNNSNNSLTGTNEDDIIQGLGGSDTLSGLDGNDSIDGGTGNDTINAGLGEDTVDGGDGSDLLILDYSSNTYTGTTPPSGIDTYIYSNGAGGFNGYYYAYYNTSYNLDSVDFFNIERFSITGTVANDKITTGDGNDTINGGDGDDTLNGGAGNNVINGGNGTDILIEANFSVATTNLNINDLGTTSINIASGPRVSNVENFTNLTTGSGNDTINFTQRFNNNIITGLGNDRINAGLGNDTVDGGDGSDILTLDYSSNTYTETNPLSGIDTNIYSNGAGGFNGAYGAYYDSIYNYDSVNFSNIERFSITGTSANDKITTGDDNDTINGGAGNDTINAGLGISVIDGGSGNDILVDANFSTATTALSINDLGTSVITLGNGTSVANIELFTNLMTGNKNDTINFSQRFNNNINTGIGNDTINTGNGNDNVDGGDGSDLLIVDYSSNTYTGTFPQAGIGTSISSNGAGGFNGYYSAYYNTIYNSDSVNFSNIERFSITGTLAKDNISTGDGNDTINGGAGNDTINGGAGINVIDGGTGIDILVDANFGTANVALNINDTGATVITLSNGTSVSNIEYFTNLTTGNKNDTISFTQSFNNNINTGLGNDTINAGNGNDTVDGGDGNDVLIVNYSSNLYQGTSPQAGINTSISSNGAGGFNGYYYAHYNTSNSNSVNFSNIERFSITGTVAKDNISTGDGNDTISSGAGNDTITAGLGINIIDGGTGTDILIDANFSAATTALSINDTGTTPITLADGTSISNVEYFANLTTGSANDTINFTQRFNNNINTGLGDDTINSGLGRDTVDGGDGNDLLILDYSSNTYTGNSPQAGITTNIYSNGAGGFNGYYYAYYNNSSDYDSVDFYNIERFSITGTQAKDNITTGEGDDTISGSGGNDKITAAGGNDILTGGLGNDTLLGGTGNDLLTGGDGIDSLTGGSGLDQFIFNAPSEGIDIITDFKVVDDTIVLSASGFAGGLAIGTLAA
ncbi:hypothetical protein C7H19_13985, partial [Aphanothece hegewaldii CCALA 016]